MKKLLISMLAIVFLSQCGDPPTAPIADDEMFTITVEILSSNSMRMVMRSSQEYGCEPVIATKFAVRDNLTSFIVEGIVEGDGSCEQRASSRERLINGYQLRRMDIEMIYQSIHNVFRIERSNSQAPWVIVSASQSTRSRIELIDLR